MSWTTTRLRYVAELNPPIRPDILEDLSREVSFLPMEAVGEDGSLDLERMRPVREVRNGYSYFEDGDVAMAKVTPCFENGKGALMRGLAGGVGFGTTELTVLRPQQGVDARFLRYFLASAQFMAEATGAMTGAGGLKRVPDWFVRDYPALWPNQVAQERIANFLDEKTARIDALIAEKRLLLERLEELRLSNIYAHLSGEIDGAPRRATRDEWFPAVPEHWSFCALNYRYEVELGKMLDEKKQSGANPIPYLRNADVRWGYVNTDDLPTMDIADNERKRYTVDAGDLLVCEGGAGVGRTAIWTGPSGVFGFQKALHRLRPRQRSDVPRFIMYLMRDAVARGRALGHEKATIPHLTAEAFRRWRFPFPPAKEQARIVAALDQALDKCDELERHCHEHIERLREHRSSLISAAVTGQLDINCFEVAA